MTITSDAFFHRLGRDGKIGCGGAYMAGDWHADDLPGVLTAFGRRLTRLIHPRLQRMRGSSEPDPPPPPATAAALRAGAAPSRAEHDRGSRPQRLAALRPLERALRTVPGRDD